MHQGTNVGMLADREEGGDAAADDEAPGHAAAALTQAARLDTVEHMVTGNEGVNAQDIPARQQHQEERHGSDVQASQGPNPSGGARSTNGAGPHDEHEVDTTPTRTGRTTCVYRGYKYTRAWASSKKTVFRCSKFRQGCLGKLEFEIASMGYSCVKMHTCRVAVAASSVLNVINKMRAEADVLAIEHVAWPVRQVWETLRDRYYSAEYPAVMRGLSEQKVAQRVHRARRQHYSGNVHGSIEIPPLSLTLDEALPFFQFHYTTMNHEDFNTPTRLLGWAHPSLVALLRYHGTTLFVDGTFRCVPSGYAQCVVLMVHDRASGIFVPVFYILSTSRTGDSYWDMIHFVVQATDQQLNPAEIVCDFEAGLLNALQTQFPNAIVLGCLFHLKQALRRAMKRYAIPEEECVIAMMRGVLDMLTVIDPAQVEKGVKWVKREIKQRCAQAGVIYSTDKWIEFWGYFDRTWIEQYSIDVWNVSGLDNELIARTNNPLERFNRELNSRFPTPHPSMATFVTVIKKISAEYVRRVADVPRGRVRRAQRELIQLPKPVEIPSDIESDIDEPLTTSATHISITGPISL